MSLLYIDEVERTTYLSVVGTTLLWSTQHAAQCPSVPAELQRESRLTAQWLFALTLVWSMSTSVRIGKLSTKSLSDGRLTAASELYPLLPWDSKAGTWAVHRAWSTTFSNQEALVESLVFRKWYFWLCPQFTTLASCPSLRRSRWDGCSLQAGYPLTGSPSRGLYPSSHTCAVLLLRLAKEKHRALQLITS